MNIDDLKDAWQHDNRAKTTSLHEMITGKTSSAIEKIRRNMRNEFIGTLLSYGVLSGFLFRHPQAPLFFNLSCIMLFALTLLTCYYFIKFYLFYKAIARYDIDLKKSIRKVTYELELNIELYRSFNLCATPMALIVAIGVVWGKNASDHLIRLLSSAFTATNILLVFGSLLVAFLAAYFFIGLHIKLNYGKHLKELKTLMSDLESGDA